MTETEPELDIMSRMSFGHLRIDYDGDVLRPRPWTRQQSVWAAVLLAELPAGDVLELCAGVGHIGLLAVSGTARHLVQVDANGRACELATGNAAAAGRGAGWSVEVRHGALEELLDPAEMFALVLADPPWVRSDRTVEHPSDPLSAIDGGPDGLDAVRSCLDVIGRHLAPDGAALLQVGPTQPAAVRTYVEQRPALGLRVVEHRLFDDGALVHLVRLTPGSTG